MITPRTTRLIRVADLSAFRIALASLATARVLRSPPAIDSILVPTRAAAEQLRRSIEDRQLAGRPTLVLPDFVPVGELVTALAQRLVDLPPMLSDAEREALLGVACRDARDRGLRAAIPAASRARHRDAALLRHAAPQSEDGGRVRAAGARTARAGRRRRPWRRTARAADALSRRRLSRVRGTVPRGGRSISTASCERAAGDGGAEALPARGRGGGRPRLRPERTRAGSLGPVGSHPASNSSTWSPPTAWWPASSTRSSTVSCRASRRCGSMASPRPRPCSACPLAAR